MRDNERDQAKRPCEKTEQPPARRVIVSPCHPVTELRERLVHLGRIDAGGMAVINKVQDANLLRTAAMKVIQPDLEDDETSVGRMIEEAQITAQLGHPNIVPVHELGVDEEGRVFFTMKLVEGRNLRAILRGQDYERRTTGELFELTQIFIKICDAVGFAHSRGVIHRDLKPENIMIGEFGQVYVMDWGIALLEERARPSARDREMPETGRLRYEVMTEEGMLIGTPGYMSPEQARGDIQAIDVRTDVFSLGAILYEILTQAPPHFGRTAQELVVNTLTRQIMPPEDRVALDLPAALCRIAMKALCSAPEDRYQSASELKRDVEAFLLSGWRLRDRAFPPGALIVREGDPGTEAYVITAGRCQVFKTIDGRELVLREMRPGDVFGETAVLTGAPRTASVRAVDHVAVTVVPREQLDSEMGAGSVIAQFMRTLAERFREKDGRAVELEIELSGSELSISILKYLNFSGTTNGDRREAKWSTLCEVLASYFRTSEAEVARLVERLGTFDVDAGRDLISLQR